MVKKLPIAAIIDIVESKKIGIEERAKILETLHTVLKSLKKEVETNIAGSLLANPAVTGGDSLEILAKNSKPIVYIVHRLLIHNIPIRLGLGTGEIHVWKESADECDGPAFWEARKALEASKKNKTITWVSSHDTSKKWEVAEAKLASTLFLLLEKMSQEQRKYCFDYVWRNIKIKDIAEKERVSISNVSQIIKKSRCKAIKHLILR